MNTFLILLGEVVIGVVVGCILVLLIAATIKAMKDMKK